MDFSSRNTPKFSKYNKCIKLIKKIIRIDLNENDADILRKTTKINKKNFKYKLRIKYLRTNVTSHWPPNRPFLDLSTIFFYSIPDFQ